MRILHLEIYVGPPRTEQAQRIAHLEAIIAEALAHIEAESYDGRKKALAVLRLVKGR